MFGLSNPFRQSHSINIVHGHENDASAPSDDAGTPPAPQNSIVPAERSDVNTTTSQAPAGDPADVAAILRAVTPLVWQVLIGLVVGYAGFTIYGLFHNHLGADVGMSALAVVASVGVLVGMGLLTRTSEKHSVRGLAGLYLVVWIAITLCLVALEAVLSSALLSSFVPEAFSSMGGVIAALLAALALVPVMTLPLVASYPDPYTSSAAASSHYIGLVAKGAGILASTFASAYFGLSRGINPALAAFLGIIVEGCFLWAYLSLIKARQQRDVFDMVLWALALVPFGAFIALISIETVSTLANISVPVLAQFKDVGATLFVCAIGLTVALAVVVHVLTSLIDLPLALVVQVGSALVGGARHHIQHEWNVYRNRRNTLPQPAAIQLAKDGTPQPRLEERLGGKDGKQTWKEYNDAINAKLARDNAEGKADPKVN